MQIEEIIQGKKGKLIIRAEGGLSFPLYEKEAAKYRLTEGGTLTEQEWNEICSEILEKRAKRRAMYILQRMERTECQLRPETAGERLSGRNRGVCHGLCEVFSLCG